MRPFIVKLFCWIGLWACFVTIAGCGSSDLLDTIPLQYTASMSPMDGDTVTDDIDIYQDVCDTEFEDFFDANAQVSVETDSTSAALRINRYVVYVTPLHGTYISGSGRVAFTPPELSSALTGLEYNFDQVVANAGGGISFEILIWTVGDKLLYRTELATALGSSVQAAWSDTVYSVHVDFYATDENNHEVTFEADMTFNLSNVDNC